RTYPVEVHVSNLRPDLVLDDVTPPEITVTLSGLRREFLLFNPRLLRVNVDARRATVGKKTLQVADRDVRYPKALALENVDPASVRISVRRAPKPTEPSPPAMPAPPAGAAGPPVGSTWEASYGGELQGLWSLIALPVAFLVALPWLRLRTRGSDPRAARFVRVWTVVFAAETIVDPLAIVRLGAPMLPFVLLGDYRVFLLVLGVAEPERSLAATCARAAAWTLVVPVVAGLAYRAGAAIAGPLPEQVLWLIYECAFVALALWWRARFIPAWRPPALRYLRAVLAYV